MAKGDTRLGILGAVIVVLTIMGLLALAAHYLGVLPDHPF
jgi:hypothetical protein